MSKVVVGLTALALALSGGVTKVATDRAKHWRPIFEDISDRSGAGPVGTITVFPGKGCGWSFGETVWAEVQFGEQRGMVKICLSRNGERWVDITTTLSGPLDDGPAA